MTEQVKLLSMTAVLTVLIWASADSLVNEAVTVRVSFELVANPGMRVQVDSDAELGWVEIEVSGPRRIVEDAQARDLLKARLHIPERPTGRTTITLDRGMLKRAIMEDWKEFRKLTIVSIQPSTLPIIVDHMITRELAVTTHRLTLAYDEEPQPKQMFITVQMRASRYEMLRPEQQSQIDISAEVERLLREEPAGQPVLIVVSLDSRVFGPGAKLEPERIEVTATVKADRVTKEIPTVPIKLVVSFANLAKPYQAVARDGTILTLVTQTIKVTGSTEDVARLLRGETRAYGFIQLKQADLEELGAFKAWTPGFHLPPNVKLAEPPKPIEFQLINAFDTGY